MKFLSSLRVRLFLLLVLFSVVPVTVLALWTLDEVEDTFSASTYQSLQGVTRAKTQGIEQFIVDRQAEAEQIANLVAPQLQSLLASGQRLPDEEDLPDLEDGSPRVDDEEEPQEPDAEGMGEILIRRRSDPTGSWARATADLEERLNLILWDQERFEELLVIDLEGRVVSSTYPSHQGRSAAELDYFVRGQGGTYLQPVFRSPITDELTIVLSTPIRGDDRGTVGVLAARLNLTRFFDLINDYTGLGRTGEVLLGRIEGDQAIFMAPTRHDPDAALTRAVDPATANTRPLAEASRGGSGFGPAVDYRSRRVLAAWEPVEGLDAGLVLKIDRSEAREPVRQAQLQIAIVLLLLVLAAFLASALAARSLVEPIRQLERATDRISRGDMDVQLDIRSEDEIGELARSFERMVAAIRYFRTRPAAEAPDQGLLEAEREEEAAAHAADLLDQTQAGRDRDS
jgi:HAMP domain-containing protein